MANKPSIPDPNHAPQPVPRIPAKKTRTTLVTKNTGPKTPDLGEPLPRPPADGVKVVTKKTGAKNRTKDKGQA